ncbi:hypothetical protein PT2222_70355 [Paraburkholderia tropica]
MKGLSAMLAPKLRDRPRASMRAVVARRALSLAISIDIFEARGVSGERLGVVAAQRHGGHFDDLVHRLTLDGPERRLHRFAADELGLRGGGGHQHVVVVLEEIRQLLGTVGAEDEDLALLVHAPHGLDRAHGAAFVGRVDHVDVGVGREHVADHAHGFFREPCILFRDHVELAALARFGKEALCARVAQLGQLRLEADQADRGRAAEFLLDEACGGLAGSAAHDGAGRPHARGRKVGLDVGGPRDDLDALVVRALERGNRRLIAERRNDDGLHATRHVGVDQAGFFFGLVVGVAVEQGDVFRLGFFAHAACDAAHEHVLLKDDAGNGGVVRGLGRAGLEDKEGRGREQGEVA